MTVNLVVVSHSEKIADGAVELAAQMAPDVMILPAGGTGDGRIGTSLELVMAALEQAGDANTDGIVVLTDLGSAVMTAESAVEFLADPGLVLLADAPLVEGLVAAAVAAQSGADLAAVRDAAEAVYRPPAAGQHPHGHRPPEATGDFELVNQAGMHARPAAKIAGGLSGMDAEVTISGADGASMTELMMLGAVKGTVLHVEASGPDATQAVDYLRGLITAGFGEP
ncbi:dihydroxyacetone kinase phosphoryl donor subunit DhaM [Arthrobacter sp. H16F315]|uniref:dihydroxyacetone kinase phosphoryl donor subunit DhaM n=1 Tax=Arthrobacter sp. H16F315 TaxID=2955314 RepID=UPI002096EBAA|nr:dihydroxyacetone kinase phosphoryl donor subunit DhaM [Arthrobacter sp. H16F315]MDD1475987.1 dihydroxyacetone kinase phosphoryl donor subunit DhaM [Arthrobacter sp. H16F315]